MLFRAEGAEIHINKAMEWNGVEWILLEDALWSFWVVLVTFGRFGVKKTPFFSVVLSGRAKNAQNEFFFF